MRFESIGRRLLVLILLFTGTGIHTLAQASDSAGIEPKVAIIDAEQLIQMANDRPDLLIIDSRLAFDRKRGFIEGSTALADTETNCSSLAKAAPDKNQTLVFYCSGSNSKRSEHASETAKSCGYQKIFWFRGGFEEWVQKKYMYKKN